MLDDKVLAKDNFDDEIVDEEIIQLVGFKLGDEEYAIDILKVQEIIRMVEITAVPRVDHFVLGVMNLRGKVIPVVDLRLRFNLDKSDFDKNTRIIVVNFEKESIGFVVDEVTEVMRITKSIVEPTPPLVGSVGQEYILGICKYNERLIILLDIDRVIFGESKEDSELKKRFFNNNEDSGSSVDIEESTQNENNTSTHKGEEAKEEQIAIAKEEEVKPETNIEKEVMVVDEDTKSESTSDLDDIDALIAAELEKREKETEELIKKKKKRVEESVDEVLNDALEQSEKIYQSESEHVSQDDLDALIAAELEKREKETEELIKRKKSKKKIVESDESVEFQSENTTVDNEEENINNDNLVIERDSVEEIKQLAEKIIKGEISDLDIDIKGEVGELLKLLLETKNKIDDLEPTINDSSVKIPTVKESLDDVTEKAETAALNLMNNTEKMVGVYKEMEDLVNELEGAANSNDETQLLEILDKFDEKVSMLDSMGFEMLNSLEFQDLTEQKIRKIISYTEEIGAKFGAILGYIKVKQMHGEKLEVSQEDVDKLLSDFGLN
ncbi:hypothetical protein DEFDS_1703 [Deferribacter desulfuricans SSM1]|uniref:Chemotaxis protein CheW n=1 Tax=Deferribacter desulfuricans (strain DSM 14783 / JCM 11476 / NBRC 101012 / SSM1) TaxID=639282 RepID=D3P8W9_DEFDS|nr:chemotaxis protein CheW [Deferribacter desulfuricans]BAI81159.1 hypothetical protein DEFDS_1703 [Deferribacter desulfuricans SSM1]